jgi:outer membrane lipoprotein-sorting protein
MSPDGSNSPDMVTNVVSAFEAMDVPGGPGVQETIDAIRRAQGSPRSQARRPRLSLGRRLAVGGVGLSAVAAVVWLIVTAGDTRQLSAMERMARHLREVKSYSYTFNSETTTTRQDPVRRTTWRENGRSFWRAPDSFRSADKIVKIQSPHPKGEPAEEVLEDFAEIFPPGGMGIFINHKQKTFVRCQYDPTGSRTYPLEPLKLIREDNPPRTRDLGTRKIAGKTARGYLVPLSTGSPPRRHDWQVWLDPQTNLPLEISYEVDDRQQPRTTTVLRIGNFRWNEEIDPKLFDPIPPAGYREVRPPKTTSPSP